MTARLTAARILELVLDRDVQLNVAIKLQLVNMPNADLSLS